MANKPGKAISYKDGHLVVPNHPIIPFIVGDGIGADVTPPMQKVVNAAVKKAYGDEKSIQWLEVLAGEKAGEQAEGASWLPKETIKAFQTYKVGIKGPLTTPVGTGIRSLNVALRQQLDLYICLRPVRYFAGSPSPLKEPWNTNMVIFRENSEGIYTGIEWKAGSDEANKVLDFLVDPDKGMGVDKIRFRKNCGVGVKVVSEEGSKRLIRAAFDYAIKYDKKFVTLVHKGNIMKFTEGAFRDWGFALAQEEYGGTLYKGGPWVQIPHSETGKPIIIKDCIADAFMQQILLRPTEHEVVATMNLNGDYISDALAAQVGGIGIAPGANIGKEIALFEATHGTAPKQAGQNSANPGSLILSAEMMLRYLGWDEAADLIIHGLRGAIASKRVTYDFARLMNDATQVTTSEFSQVVIENMSI